MELVDGVLIGKVKKTDDEDGTYVDGTGRICVEFPWTSGKQMYWMPVATLMAGSERGSWFMPEEGDEVVVAFDHGDINHPFVIGFLWNGKDKPPELDPKKRVLKTKAGHIISIDDTENKGQIEIKTAGGAIITLSDENKAITINAPEKITIEAKQISVKGTDSVTVESKQVTVNGSDAVTVKSSSKVAVEAPKITLGTGALEPAVHGDYLFTYLNQLAQMVANHTHTGGQAGPFPVIIPPATMLPPVQPPIKALLESQVVKGA